MSSTDAQNGNRNTGGPPRHAAHSVPFPFVLLAFAGALALRLIRLGAKSLWSDEAASWGNAIEPVTAIMAGQDIHPPGYYLLLHWITAISQSEFALRFPSAIASSLGAAVVFAVGWKLFGPRVGAIAGSLAVVSPLDVWYAQEARQPAIAALALIVGAYGLWRKDNFGSILAALMFALSLFMDYVSIAGWAVFGGVWVYIHWKSDRSQAMRWAIFSAPVLLIFMLFLGDRFEEGTRFLGGPPMDFYDPIFGSPITRSAPGVFILIFLGSLIASRLTHLIIRHPSSLLSVWFPLILIGLALAVLPIPRAYSIKKVLVIGWPLPLLLISQRLATLKTPIRTFAVGSLLATSLVATAVNLFVIDKEDWRAVTHEISASSIPGEIVWVFESDWAPDAYRYYGGKLEVRREREPAGAILETDPAGVWLITSRSPRDPIPSMPSEAWFDANWVLRETRAYDRLALKHYLPPS